MQAALGQRKEVAIFGEDYDTPDGTCVRDYVHVEDLIAAHHWH
ncbi:NAD-dependent epimerase/dehydratase family protein [Bifidobacterium longum]|nr:NAD-dependent epimerase/dehydratase family protein [Bifidobacterium longum]